MDSRMSFEDRLNIYLGELRGYVTGGGDNPSFDSQGVQVFFDKRLAKKIVKSEQVFRKHLAALKHGYVGEKKGLNGIRNIHENDGRICDAVLSAFESSFGKGVIERYGLGVDNLQTVKIVAHDPSGRRMYGFMDSAEEKAVFFGAGWY